MRRTVTFTDDAKHRNAVLRVMCLALMMVVAAVASLNVALPEIARDTGATQTQLQWIVDAYALAFAALLLPAGAIGDRYGRKPVLAFGLSLFGLASFLALFVHTPGALISLRVVMGIGAAFIMPVTLSVITTVFPPEERGKAVGTWVGIAAGGAVIGLVVSGLLLEWLSWPSIFALNVVLAVVALAGTLAIVPATRAAIPPRLDPVGTLISITGLSALDLRDHRRPRARLVGSGHRSRPRRRRGRARALRRLGAAPRRPDARPAQLPPARLRRGLALRSPSSSSRRSASSSSPCRTSSSCSAIPRSTRLPRCCRWRSS